jgi:hypothetical protein
MNTWDASTSIQGSNSRIVNPNSIPPFTLIDFALLVMVSVALLSAMSLTIGKLSGAYRQKIRQQSFGVSPANSLPCQRCRYFCANPYLKCTVHPMTVMTEASSDCSDYSPPKPLV